MVINRTYLIFLLLISYDTLFACEQVSVDSGELELDKVYDLIIEGNDLLVDVEKELKVMNLNSV